MKHGVCFLASGFCWAVMEGVAGVFRVECRCNKLSPSHVQVLFDCEYACFVVQVWNISGAGAASGNAECGVLYGLELGDVRGGSYGGPGGAGVVEAGADVLFI